MRSWTFNSCCCRTRKTKSFFTWNLHSCCSENQSGTSLQDPDYQSQRVTPVSKATFPIPVIRPGKVTPGVTVCQPTLPRLEITKATEHLGPKGKGRRRKHLVLESTSQANVLCHKVSAVLFRKAPGKGSSPTCMSCLTASPGLPWRRRRTCLSREQVISSPLNQFPNLSNL